MDETEKTYWTDNDDLVEKYVLDQISAEEKERMDQEIADCQSCKKKLREELELAAGVRRHGRDTVRLRLQTALNRQQTSPYFSYQYIGLAAAVVIVAFGIGIYTIWFGDLESPKQFHEKEIVLTPPFDTADGSVSSDAYETLAMDQPMAEETDVIPDETQTPHQEDPHLADAGTVNNVIQPPASSVAGAPMRKETHSVTSRVEALQSAGSGESSSSIWLIGKVVMVSDLSERQKVTASRVDVSGKTSGEMGKKITSESKKTLGLRMAKDEGITLQQRTIKGLPSELSNLSKDYSSREQAVQTLLERTDTGISLTLFGDAVSPSDLQNAVIETFTDDSLVVTLPSQRIAFRMPPGWSRHASLNR